MSYHAIGEAHGSNKLKEEQVRLIKRLALEGTYSLREIGQLFGVSKAAVADIKAGRNWRWLFEEAAEAGEMRDEL